VFQKRINNVPDNAQFCVWCDHRKGATDQHRGQPVTYVVSTRLKNQRHLCISPFLKRLNQNVWHVQWIFMSETLPLDFREVEALEQPFMFCTFRDHSARELQRTLLFANGPFSPFRDRSTNRLFSSPVWLPHQSPGVDNVSRVVTCKTPLLPLNLGSMLSLNLGQHVKANVQISPGDFHCASEEIQDGASLNSPFPWVCNKAIHLKQPAMYTSKDLQVIVVVVFK
jgi:hypothetical protein